MSQFRAEMKKRGRKRKEEIVEDYCFSCKDGGHLHVRDFKNCLKAYHAQCVSKDAAFLESDERWTCGWHSCFICHKSSAFQCYCCPSSICRGCIGSAEFIQVKKKTKGFCNNCLKLAILAEENAQEDSDGGKVDFEDRETVEFLFKDYWVIVKEQEGLSLADLHDAHAILKRGESYKSGSDSDKLFEEELMSDGDDMDDNCDMTFRKDCKAKRSVMKTPMKNCRSRKKVFVGWGSKELIGFLSSIGKDTSKPLSQLDVSDIVRSYSIEHNLMDPEKKKKVIICDKRLLSLFRKKKVKIQMIFHLLESHLAENADVDDDISFSSEEGGTLTVHSKRQKINSDSKGKSESNQQKKKITEPPKSEYAAFTGANIKSVYLRRSLILRLLDNPETFENKVVGCFVRVKSDPKDFYYNPRKPYQLGQVKGIKKIADAYKVGQTSTNVVLCILNMWKDIHISMLSDEDIEEEECEDLHQMVKKGQLKRLKIGELKEKIKVVHADIMNYWIDREIRRLQKFIERANEKGWRRELENYIDQRELLRKPDERARLLQEHPNVIPDIEEAFAGATTAPPELQCDHGNGFSIVKTTADKQATGSGGESIEIAVGEETGAAEKEAEGSGNGPSSMETAAEKEAEGSAEVYHPTFESEVFELQADGPSSTEAVAKREAEGNGPSSAEPAVKKETEGEQLKPKEVDGIRSCNKSVDITNKEAGSSDKAIPRENFIDLVDDDDDDDGSSNDMPTSFKLTNSSLAKTVTDGKDTAIPMYPSEWYYLDPSHMRQGPFSLIELRHWSLGGYFNANFKIWKMGQTEENAVLLTDLLQKMFPQTL